MMKASKLSVNRRTTFFMVVMITAFAILITRLYFVQIIDGVKWKSKGENQYFQDISENFNRGSIFFSNKTDLTSPAVGMFNQYDIALDPKTINSDFEKKDSAVEIVEFRNNLYDKIQSIFEEYNQKDKSLDSTTTSSSILSRNIFFVDKATFLTKISNTDSSFESLVKDVPEDIAEKITAINLRGLIVNRKKSRLYFENDLASKVLGFVGFKDNRKTGLYGIEKYYNDVLEREAVSNANFFAEVFSDLKSEDSLNNDNLIAGFNLKGDINLTLDINVERYLQKVLKETKEKWNPKQIGGIVMDINDGSIVAMDGLPAFDPNNYSDVADISVYNNDLISGVYEMGSIIKPLTIAAALDSGAVNENTTYNDTGSITLNGYKISNYDKMSRGPNTPLQQILSQSLNVGIAFVVQKMGGNELSKYFHRFGLGEYTGIDLPNEVSGLVSNLDSKIIVDSVTAGFGQGIAISPIQTIRALATLGNGGKLVTPHVVKSITYDNGDTKVIAVDEPTQVFDNSSTSERISKILIKVVDEAMHAKNPRYSIAAKTGTAQMVDSVTGKYYDDKYLHSFFGYFPATNPRYIIFLYQLDPKGAQYASQTLKEGFFDLVNYLITYFEIQPDR